MKDIRAQLRRDNRNGPNRKRKGPPRYIMLHWPGPTVFDRWGNYPGDLKTIKGYANYHVDTKKWDGISYAYVIGREDTYQTRSWDDVLYHAGVSEFNEYALPVLVLAGKAAQNDLITDSMWHRLWMHVKALMSDFDLDWRYVLGHQEAPRSTECPGAVIMRWLNDRRAEVQQSNVTARVQYNANIRDEPNALSDRLGGIAAGNTLTGTWILGKPVGGDSLWFKLAGDRYIHASALNTSSYRPAR